MIKNIIAFKFVNLLIFSLVVYLASFAIPTGALFFILSFSAITISAYEITILIAIIFISTVLGDISTYFFATLFSKKVNKIFNITPWLKKNEEQAHKFIEKYGFYAIFFSRFIFSGIGPILNYYCGIKKYNYKKFILAILGGELIYSIIYVTLGIIFKNFINEILNLINGIFILGILGFMIYLTINKIKQELKQYENFIVRTNG